MGGHACIWQGCGLKGTTGYRTLAMLYPSAKGQRALARLWLCPLHVIKAPGELESDDGRKLLAEALEAQRTVTRHEDIAHGIDRAQPNVTATCPFCGGTYAAGHLTSGGAGIRHSEPACVRFLAGPRSFLTDANKLARDRRRLT
jgi:hypothetical protein